MPAVHINTANIAGEVRSLVARVTSVRGSSGRARGVRIISGGIIAAIVIAVVVLIVAVIFGIFIFRRHKKQRARRQQEMQKYYGDNRSSIGTEAPSGPAPGQANFGNTSHGYGYGQGAGYGYAHTAQPGQAGYNAQNHGGVPPMAPAYTADHVTHTK
ncbi:uncharacterized protein ColSpa_07700 [Colletotrichum spaethianum]|uniref:Uncharacterized protein n=1 Tax=Colletotrichum spaethianum TaxID=700344 RepID=A0AA37UI81_9PEZI|nr:uncharacterized protein ColSpa_07700 [Colletotrichum spaethianum]GKT47519.1 hypothetical protein ColSpa_07700 [Colletotrichum spaethianum]